VIVAGLELTDAHAVGGGDICTAYRARTADGRTVFAKTHARPPRGFFAAEAVGLDLLRVAGVAGGLPVPEVVAVGDDGLVLEWVTPGRPSVEAARAFGRGLAVMHSASMPAFGAAADGFIGSLSLPNAGAGDWCAFYVEQRVRPFLGSLTREQRQAVEEVCARIEELAGPAEPPARIHGDLWSGNLLWADDGQVWLIDAASAHGGHRETDLAMLALFGAPYLDDIVAAYQQAAPLAAGWQSRVGLHQLHPLLVHATLFGGGYGDRAAAVARRLLRG
jgi:fructosamine-3-kinase